MVVRVSTKSAEGSENIGSEMLAKLNVLETIKLRIRMHYLEIMRCTY